MKSIYDEYKQKLVDGINKVMGEKYAEECSRMTIDDLEVMFSDEVGEDKLLELQKFYGLDE